MSSKQLLEPITTNRGEEEDNDHHLHPPTFHDDRTNTTTTQSQSQIQPPPLRILVITMGGHRRTVMEQMFATLQSQPPPHTNRPRRRMEVTYIDGIPSRELRTRTKLFYHCHRAQLIPPLEYQAYLNYIHDQNHHHHHPDHTNNTIPINDDTNWTSCFDGIPMDPHRKGSATDRSLHYCVELWRKVKTINRGRSVLACLLIHLIALHQLTTESYDTLLEDNVRCNTGSTTSFMEQIQTIIDATMTPNHDSKCHMRYYGWLGSLPNLHWIYNTYIPRYMQNHTNSHTTTHPSNNIIMVPCPIPSDIDDIDEVPQSTPTETVTSKRISEEMSRNGNDCHDKDVKDDCDEEENLLEVDIDMPTQLTSLSLLAPPTILPPPPPPQPQPTTSQSSPQLLTTPGGTNLVWGTYAYWISPEAYQIILQTLQNDIGAIVWKGKRMRYYHVKPIDKVIPRILRNHFDATHQNHRHAKNDTGTTIPTTVSSHCPMERSSCIQIPIRPIFFRAPMLSSNIHTKWDAQFCASTHYQMQQMSSTSLLCSTATATAFTNAFTNTVSSYQDLFLSETERMVVEYAQLHDYRLWMTPPAILDAKRKQDKDK